MRPSLAILVPTYNRARYVEGLLRTLAADADVRSSDVRVLVGDNGSSDETVAVVRSVTEIDVELHEHGENIGPVANVAWLVEHAPEVDYLWVMGDDDRPKPGAVGTVLDFLARQPVTLLHLPHTFERDGAVAASSTCPAEAELFERSLDLSLGYHHWVTFISASVLDRLAFQRACRELPTVNEWGPHIWYLNAARESACAVLDRPLVAGGMDATWSDKQVPIYTARLVETFDAGLHRVMDEAGFARYLDDFYGDVGRQFWAQVPLEDCLEAARRFPASRQLREVLFDNARGQGRADILAGLDAAARAAGAGEEAEALVAEGEARFAEGDPRAAAQRFRDATQVLPTYAEAWNDLGVALHALSHPAAREAFEIALLLDPANEDARQNHASLAA